MFDYCRFAGCLLIFLYHYDGLCGFGLKVNRSLTLDFIIRNGNEAITLFFMLSGFCMACRYRDRISSRKVSFASYAFGHYKKFLTMILVTLPITVIKAICMYKAGLDTMPNLFGFTLDILGIRTGYGMHSYFGYNGPLWFINVLFIMYILYYLVSYLCQGRAVYTGVCIALVLFSVSQQAIGTISCFVLNSNCYIGIAGFFIGAVLYEIYDYYEESPGSLKRIRSLCFMLIIIICAAIYLNVHFPGQGVLPEDSNLWVNYSLVLTLVFWPSLLLILSGIRIPSGMQGLTWLFSRLSTSIYIWHWPVIYILYSFGVMGSVRWIMGSRTINVLACTITLIFALLSALFLEKWVQKGIEGFFRKG